MVKHLLVPIATSLTDPPGGDLCEVCAACRCPRQVAGLAAQLASSTRFCMFTVHWLFFLNESTVFFPRSRKEFRIKILAIAMAIFTIRPAGALNLKPSRQTPWKTGCQVVSRPGLILQWDLPLLRACATFRWSATSPQSLSTLASSRMSGLRGWSQPPDSERVYSKLSWSKTFGMER